MKYALAAALILSVFAVSCGEMPESTSGVSQSTSALTTYGGEKRTLRLAIAATAQHFAAYSSLADYINSVQGWVGELNAFLLPELSIEFVLVGNDGTLVSTNTVDELSALDANRSALLNASRTWINGLIGESAYDVGFTLASAATGNGLGLSAIGALCSSAQGRSVLAVNRLPVSDALLNFQLHHFGHALGANHTFDSEQGNCTGLRTSSTAVEPGAGATLMSFAGLCGVDNTGSYSRQFHSVTRDVLTDRLDARPTCGTISAVANTPPAVLIENPSVVIPRGTPFLLEGTATDTEDQANLRYGWEQIDVDPLGGNALADGDTGANPLFRVFERSGSGTRTFPRDPLAPEIGETLPETSRTLSFRLQVSDQNPLGGAFSSAEATVTVIGSAGPFVQTTSSTDWLTGTETVTWDVAGTDLVPVSCDAVDILLSVDDGSTFDIVLVQSSENDGTETVNVPAVISSRARLRVKCSTGAFFSDLAITVDGTQCTVSADCDDGNVCNGEETCSGIECIAGVPLACDDGQFCTGVESCDPLTGCVDGVAPEIDDNDVCTTDSCDEDADAIVNEPITGCGTNNNDNDNNSNGNDNTNSNENRNQNNDNTNSNAPDDEMMPDEDPSGRPPVDQGCNCNGLDGFAFIVLAGRYRRRRNNK